LSQDAREELVRDAAVLISSLNPGEGRLTDDDVSFLHDCYRDRNCSAEIMHVLQKYDTNRDGNLDLQELHPIVEGAQVVSDVQKVLSVYDADHDGKLTMEDVKHIVQDYAEKKPGSEILSRWDTNHDGTLDEKELQVLLRDIKTTDSNLRYTGYTFILPTLLRYSAYVSDFGESFRPIIALRLVRLSYAISWSYVVGDVVWEGYKAFHKRGEPASKVAETLVERAIFQSIASMLLPMAIIHTQVKVFSKIFARLPELRPPVRKWGPTLSGLAIIPFLPFMLDKPVEMGLEFVKEKLYDVLKELKEERKAHTE